MADPRSHVRPGQPLAIAAEHINWLNREMRGNAAFGYERAPYELAPNWIYAKATQQLQHRQIAFLYPSQEPVIDLDPSDEQQKQSRRRAFHSEPVVGDLRATPPSNSQLYGLHHICMTLEPAKVNDIIKIQVSGPVYVHIQMNHRYHGYCRWIEPQPFVNYHNGFGNVPLVLSSATAGPARIVWFDERNYSGPTAAGTYDQIVPAVVVL